MERRFECTFAKTETVKTQRTVKYTNNHHQYANEKENLKKRMENVRSIPSIRVLNQSRDQCIQWRKKCEMFFFFYFRVPQDFRNVSRNKNWMQLNLAPRLRHVKCHEFKRCEKQESNTTPTHTHTTARSQKAATESRFIRKNAIRLWHGDNMDMIQQFFK